MKTAVIVFPGSNCDRDAQTVLRGLSPRAPRMIWHRETELPEVDLVVLPGGFSYGDYLRSGAMAAHSPIMGAIRKHAIRGGYVLGICNGFQVLTEAQLLPGMLMRNKNLKFVCKDVFLRVESITTPFTKNFMRQQVINVPVAHHDGNYFADDDTLKSLQDNGQIVFRYCNTAGQPTEESNPNGSKLNIAGICNKEKNVLGMMPHPERHAEALLGGVDGITLFKSVQAA